jgi:hypothetical protein
MAGYGQNPTGQNEITFTLIPFKKVFSSYHYVESEKDNKEYLENFELEAKYKLFKELMELKLEEKTHYDFAFMSHIEYKGYPFNWYEKTIFAEVSKYKYKEMSHPQKFPRPLK